MIAKKYIFISLLGVLAFLPFIPFLLPEVDDMVRCIFCDIVGGKIPETKIEVDNDEFIIFKDIKPASTYHFLAVPKRHVQSLKTLTKDDDKLVVRMEAELKNFFISKGIDTNDALFGFHMPPFISVKHLHMHAIAPRSTMGFLDSFIFKPGSWFKTVEEARKYIEDKS